MKPKKISLRQAFIDTTEGILHSLAQMRTQYPQDSNVRSYFRQYFDLMELAQTNVNRIEASSLQIEEGSLIARVIEEGSVSGWLGVLKTETHAQNETQEQTQTRRNQNPGKI